MCWDCDSNPKGDPHKNYVRGGVSPDDFGKEVNYQTRTSKRKKAKPKTRPGCPENNYGPHIYVWTSEFITNTDCFFFRVFGWHKWEEAICVGCEKRMRGARQTEEYVRVKERKYAKAFGDGTNITRGTPVAKNRWRDRKPNFKFWCWEDYDEKFMKARKEYAGKSMVGERMLTNTTFFFRY